MEDLEEAHRLGFREAMFYFIRATVHLQSGHPEQARQDLDESAAVWIRSMPPL